MKKLLVPLAAILLCFSFAASACAEELSAPGAPESAALWMPETTLSFGDGIVSMVQRLLPALHAEISTCLHTCLAVLACVLFVSILRASTDGFSPCEMAGAICIGALLVRNSHTMIGFTVNTVTEISEYTKLFLPIIAAASAAQGTAASSTALYFGTSVFIAFLSNILRQVLLPAIYLFLAAAISSCAVGEKSIKQIKDQFRKFSSWFLKTAITVFLTYMTITGAVSGTADKAALKAAKTAISAAVPVIGNTLAEASEALLVSAGLIKNSIGIYGIFVFTAFFFSPFIRIGAQYLTLKATAGICSVTDCKRLTELVNDFCSALGLLLAITGTMCILSLIGTVCFLKGAG